MAGWRVYGRCHSFDHDGLGRYGDPLCPDGDLLAMDNVRAAQVLPLRQ